MICKNCGEEIEDDSEYCFYCGCLIGEEEETKPVRKRRTKISPKSRLSAFLLAFFLGCFGAHNFYLNKNSIAITQLLLTILMIICCIIANFSVVFLVFAIIFALIVSIWVLVEWILIVNGTFTDSEGRIVKKWLDN